MRLASLEDVKRQEYFQVSYSDFESKIIPFGLNPESRTGNFPADEDDQTLIDRIRGGNFYPPLEINKRKSSDGQEVYDLVSGHRRRAAIIHCKNMGVPIERIPIIVIGHNMSQADMLAHTMADSRNKQWTKSEKADACSRFVNWGWTLQKIAEKIGESVGTVQNLLTLSNGSEVVKKAVDEKTIPQSEAIRIIKSSSGNVETEKKAVANIVKEKKTGERTQSGKKRKVVPVRSERISTERQPFRDIECPEYERCLNVAAKCDTKLDCGKCENKSANAEPEMMSKEAIVQWREKLLVIDKISGDKKVVLETLDIILGYNVII
jgi:ParB-like chromosome segregation protein Spo0J